MKIVKTLYVASNKVSDIIEKILKALLILLVLGSAADLFLQVLYRFVLIHFVNFPMTWTNELAQVFLIWMAYFGIGICYKENSMASVNFLYDRLNHRGKIVLYLITRVIVFIFLYVGLKYGWKSIESVSHYTTPQPASARLCGIRYALRRLHPDDL